MVMTFAGVDSDGGMDLDTDAGAAGHGHGGTPFQLFTFRSLINFLLGFSWTGISFYHTVPNKFLLTVIAVAMGLLLVGILVTMFYLLSRAAQSGNIDISRAIGRNAVVYLPIPADNSRSGKVQISIDGAVREYDAVTTGKALRTGELVQVTGVMEGNMLRVEGFTPPPTGQASPPETQSQPN